MLPIWQIHQEILSSLRERSRLVLVAPTGSGKTTQVPQMILDSGLADESEPRRVVVLQPRRVAARTVASRVAWERQKKLGQEVGYQVRFDDQTSLGTRICYVTEGILLRWMQEDPELRDVSVILFDEFHERNLLSDVALALVKRLQDGPRPDLRMAVMSATLEAEPVAAYLEKEGRNCPVLVSEGRMFPVETRYVEHGDRRPVMEQAADAVERIVQSGLEGDILVFMPGMAEIQSTIHAVGSADLGERVDLIPLHGDLPPDEQDRAFAPSVSRKVVVATNVAETSVTIDGIRHVVDSGLARVARFDAERGVQTLLIEEISQASADQRAGRAGRTAPGTCWRLWTESNQMNRPAKNTPEIQRSDLAEVVLLLHSFGICHAARFDWLDKPDSQAVERAEELLRVLGALKVGGGWSKSKSESESGRKGREGGDLTTLGWQMLRLPMHPRFSRMLLEASERGCVETAALCAALVSGRDLLMRVPRGDDQLAEAREVLEGNVQSDFYTLIRAFAWARKNQFRTEPCRRYGIHAATARQVDQTYEQILYLVRAGGLKGGGNEDVEGPAGREALCRSIMTGFIDQLCRRRSKGTLECDLTEGRVGTLMRESVVQEADLLVAAVVKEVASPRRGGNLTLLGLATAVELDWIEQSYPDQLQNRVEHQFDRTHKRVAPVRVVKFRDLILQARHQSSVEPAAAGECLADAYLQEHFQLPLFHHRLRQWIGRINLVSVALKELEVAYFGPERVRRFLAKAFAGLTVAKHAQEAELEDAFFEEVGEDVRSVVEDLAPESAAWPDGRQLKIGYAQEAVDKKGNLVLPELQVKLHECFRLENHPRVCEGRVPVRLWLQAPNGKRLQSTEDWPQFKAKVYPTLKGQLHKKFPGTPWV